MPRLVVVPAVLLLTWTVAPAQEFDRLSDADRQVFQERFLKEVWPLMNRNGKDGCVGCHKGKLVSALHLTGDGPKDFRFMLKEGFFLHEDAGSLLGRVTAKDPQRRMPLGKRDPWTKEEISILRAFSADLDKKQKK